MDKDGRPLPLSELKAPIVVAVTGHMDIPDPDVETVKGHMKKFLKDLDDRYPNTDLHVLTPLSPGADQLAAEVALELGIRYTVVMPCDIERYRKYTFSSASLAALGNYEKLYAQASDYVVLPDMTPLAEGQSDSEEWFNYQLQCLSAYLICTSHIIMASWDGVNTGFRGGTSDLIECAHNGVDPPLLDKINHLYSVNGEYRLGDGRNSSGVAYLNIREDSLLYHIPTPRCKDDQARNEELRRCQPCYYLPRTIFESRGKEDEFSFIIPNAFGWKGIEEFPSYYREIFGKMDELNKGITDVVNYDAIDSIRGKIDGDLFNLYSFDLYLETFEAMEGRCDEIRSKNPGSSTEDIANKEDQSLDEYIRGLKGELRQYDLPMLDIRIVMVRRMRHFFSKLTSKPVGEKAQKHLKECRTKRNDLEFQIRVAEEFKSNRSGTDPQNTLKNMKAAKASAESTKDDVKAQFDIEKGASLDPLRYAVVDSLAIRQRDDNARNMSLNILLTALTSLFLALYLIPQDSKFFTMLYIIFLGLNGYLISVHNKKKVQSNYMDYRLLAETLRVKVYWDVLGISYPANDLCFSYLRNRAGWVRSAMTSWYSVATETPDNARLRNRQDLLECTWIVDQLKYHQLKSRTNSRRTHSVKKYALFFFVLNLFLSLFFVALSVFPGVKSQVVFAVSEGSLAAAIMGEGTVFTVGNIIKVGNAAASLMFTAITAYITTMIYGGTADSMVTKSKMFEIAMSRRRDSKLVIEENLNRTHDEKAYRDDLKIATELYKELGIQSIEETNSWVILHRTKNVQNFMQKYKKW